MLPQGEHRGPYLFAAKVLVPQLRDFPAIVVNPGNPSLFDYRTGIPTHPSQFIIITYYYIL